MTYAGHTDFGDTLMQYNFVARCQSPGEIKRREVNWTLTKKLAQKRSRAGRWSWA